MSETHNPLSTQNLQKQQEFGSILQIFKQILDLLTSTSLQKQREAKKKVTGEKSESTKAEHGVEVAPKFKASVIMSIKGEKYLWETIQNSNISIKKQRTI